jgi:NADH:ubiquinone oxidoreductase subunit K
MTPTLLNVVLIGVLLLLGVGFYGLLICRNLMKVVIALQILGKTAVLTLVMAGVYSGQSAVGQSLAITVIVADTVVAVVALALVVQVRRRLGTLDIKAISNLKG